MRVFSLFFFPDGSIYYLRPSFLFPPSLVVNSDPGSHAWQPLLPPPHYPWCLALLVPCVFGALRFWCLAFLSQEDFGCFFPRRLPSNCAYPRYTRSQQLIGFFPFLFLFKNILKISPRRDTNSRTNTAVSVDISFYTHSTVDDGVLRSI